MILPIYQTKDLTSASCDSFCQFTKFVNMEIVNFTTPSIMWLHNTLKYCTRLRKENPSLGQQVYWILIGVEYAAEIYSCVKCTEIFFTFFTKFYTTRNYFRLSFNGFCRKFVCLGLIVKAGPEANIPSYPPSRQAWNYR